MKAVKKFGVCLIVLTMALTGCNSTQTSNDKNVSTSTQSTTNKSDLIDYEYADKLFDNSYVHSINIEISEEDWEDLKTNALDETYYSCNITIDGETYENVGLRTKGNSSLAQVANSDSDRYSFKIKFDKFDKEQDYYGLEKLSLNNIIQDATFMKDYLSYKMMGDFGVASPYVSYSYISINGEEWGLYLNVEDIDNSFLERNYGEDHGELYKPGTAIDNMGQMPEGFDRNNMPQAPEGFDPNNMPQGAEGFDPDNMPQAPEGFDRNNMPQAPEGFDPNNMPQAPEGFDPNNMPGAPEGFDPNQMPEGFEKFDLAQMGEEGFKGMGGNMAAKGADLKYIDDNIESYANIFDNAETKIDDADKERLIASLKQLASGENLEDVVDIEATLRYFVVHNFVDNYDSYTGTMLHNYYLYEEDGKLSMLPWDYNLAFGAFGGFGGFGDGEGMTRPKGMRNQQQTSDKDIEKQDTVTNTEKNKTQVAAPTKLQEGKANNQDSATQMVNMAIDTPLSGATEEDRPLWGQLINNDTYKEQYHKLFDEFLQNYLENGAVAAEIDRVVEMISPYIQKDPTGFYTYEEFQKGVSTLKSFISLRTESIRKQLNGEISSTTEGQKTQTDKLVDGSSISISDMGSNHRAGDKGHKTTDKNQSNNKVE